MLLLIYIEMLVSAVISPLRWLVRRYPKQAFVLVMLATGVLIVQVRITGRVDPMLFTAVFPVVMLCAVGMIAVVWPTPIEDDHPRQRYQPPKIDDWCESISD